MVEKKQNVKAIKASEQFQNSAEKKAWSKGTFEENGQKLILVLYRTILSRTLVQNKTL